MELAIAILSVVAVLLPTILKARADRKAALTPKDDYEALDLELANAHLTRDYTSIALRLQRLHEKARRRTTGQPPN